MDNLIKADIFFFITAMAVALLSLLFAAVLIYIIKILRDVRYVAARLREKTDQTIEDIEDFMDNMRRKHVKVSVFSKVVKIFIKALFFKGKEKTYRKKRKYY